MSTRGAAQPGGFFTGSGTARTPSRLGGSGPGMDLVGGGGTGGGAGFGLALTSRDGFSGGWKQQNSTQPMFEPSIVADAQFARCSARNARTEAIRERSAAGISMSSRSLTHAISCPSLPRGEPAHV